MFHISLTKKHGFIIIVFVLLTLSLILISIFFIIPFYCNKKEDEALINYLQSEIHKTQLNSINDLEINVDSTDKNNIYISANFCSDINETFAIASSFKESCKNYINDHKNTRFYTADKCMVYLHNNMDGMLEISFCDYSKDAPNREFDDLISHMINSGCQIYCFLTTVKK